jgi:hypothetical protein
MVRRLLLGAVSAALASLLTLAGAAGAIAGTPVAGLLNLINGEYVLTQLADPGISAPTVLWIPASSYKTDLLRRGGRRDHHVHAEHSLRDGGHGARRFAGDHPHHVAQLRGGRPRHPLQGPRPLSPGRSISAR